MPSRRLKFCRTVVAAFTRSERHQLITMSVTLFLMRASVEIVVLVWCSTGIRGVPPSREYLLPLFELSCVRYVRGSISPYIYIFVTPGNIAHL